MPLPPPSPTRAPTARLARSPPPPFRPAPPMPACAQVGVLPARLAGGMLAAGNFAAQVGRCLHANSALHTNNKRNHLATPSLPSWLRRQQQLRHLRRGLLLTWRQQDSPRPSLQAVPRQLHLPRQGCRQLHRCALRCQSRLAALAHSGLLYVGQGAPGLWRSCTSLCCSVYFMSQWGLFTVAQCRYLEAPQRRPAAPLARAAEEYTG